MKLFKKVLAVALVGAMAVSMLTACSGSKSSKVKDALKDFDIKMDAAMVQDTEKMMGGLQQLTEKVTSGAVKLNDETQMKKISEKFGEMTDYTFSSSTGKGITISTSGPTVQTAVRPAAARPSVIRT